MAYSWGIRSKIRMKGIHPDLRKVMDRAIKISHIDMTILEGLRTLVRQKELMKAGATRTLNSRHLTGHAVDVAALVSGKVRWDWPLYKEIGLIVKRAAREVGVPIEWGGDWKTFKDGPHFQLPFKDYPK
jgi:peptidoglycan L-alanyl-D-glutamate endopeptidase CwlK